MSLIDGQKIKKTLDKKHTIQWILIVNTVACVSCLVLTASGSFKTNARLKYVTWFGSLLAASSCFVQCRKLDDTEAANEYKVATDHMDFKNVVDNDIALNKLKDDRRVETQNFIFVQEELEKNPHYQRLKEYETRARDQEDDDNEMVEETTTQDGVSDFWDIPLDAEKKEERKPIVTDEKYAQFMHAWKEEKQDTEVALRKVFDINETTDVSVVKELREELLKKIKERKIK